MSVFAAMTTPAPNRRTPAARIQSAGEEASRGSTRGSAILVTGERQKSQDARPLHGLGDLGLVPGAGAGDPPWDDLTAVGDEARQPPVVLVVDPVHLVETELAELPSIRTRFAVAC